MLIGSRIPLVCESPITSFHETSACGATPGHSLWSATRRRQPPRLRSHRIHNRWLTRWIISCRRQAQRNRLKRAIRDHNCLPEEIFCELFFCDFEIRSCIREDLRQRSDTKLFVGRNCEVMFEVFDG